MPTLNGWGGKPKTTKHNDTPMRQLRQKAYSSTEWQKTRDVYLSKHPLCERCLAEGKVTPAGQVHHRRSPFRTGEINWNLLTEQSNLMALCPECHRKEHLKEEGKDPAETIANLERLLDDGREEGDSELLPETP